MAAGLLAACTGDDSPKVELVPVHDLAAELVAAEIETEVRRIAFDSQEIRRYLRSGWSRNERDRGFAWGLGEASVVEFSLLEARDFELRLEGRPFRFPGAPPQVVTVAVNGHTLGEIELSPRLAGYALPLASEQQLAGANRLELSYRWNRCAIWNIRSPRRRSERRDHLGRAARKPRRDRGLCPGASRRPCRRRGLPARSPSRGARTC